MRKGVNITIVYNTNIMQLAVFKDPLASLKAKVFNVQTYPFLYTFVHVFFAFDHHKSSYLAHVTCQLNGHTFF